MQDVIVDQEVVAQEGQLVFHVPEETANERCEVDDVRRLVLLKYGLCRVEIPS